MIGFVGVGGLTSVHSLTECKLISDGAQIVDRRGRFLNSKNKRGLNTSTLMMVESNEIKKDSNNISPPSSALEGMISDSDEQVPFDFRRTTFVVSDLENSLKFYRDALGMKVIRYGTIKTPPDAQTIEESDRWNTLAFLRCNNSFIGVLGLLQYKKPVMPVLHEMKEVCDRRVGESILVFTSNEPVEEKIKKAAEVPGARISEPTTYNEYPAYSGKGVIKVSRTMLKDPDGFLVEMNQLLSPLI
mmetsp:Transcript_4240/g.7434  ORF Transcript_4240/g.7434 Transcript_4240/m.7434 type:complete len:244 (-) Transcript_4240:776-1507(-)